MYIGNYPELKSKDIKYICKIINESVTMEKILITGGAGYIDRF